MSFNPVVKVLGEWYKSWVSVIYPLKCVVCNSPIPLEKIKSEFLCADCFPQIKFVLKPACEKCGRPSHSRICSECNKKHKLFFDRAFSVAIYEGIWKELIHVFKYGKNDCLDKFLAEFLVELIRKNPSLKEPDFIIPVPLHWQDKWRRGYNQTYLLAYRVSKIIGIPVLANTLVKHKKISSQTALSGKERLKNVKGAFRVNNSKILEGKEVLLIDDVFTTGSTVNECARVLKEGKAKKVDVIILACSY